MLPNKQAVEPHSNRSVSGDKCSESLMKTKLNPIFEIDYSVCSLVVPRLEEAILTPVLKKNFK